MSKYVWIGHYPSEVSACDDVAKTITTSQFLEEGNNAPAYCGFSNYVLEKIVDLGCTSDLKYVFFDSEWALSFVDAHPELKGSVLNCCVPEIVNWLNDKALTRRWLSTAVRSPAQIILDKKAICVDDLKKCFPGYDDFVVQFSPSAGGSGTFLLSENSEREVLGLLPDRTPLVLSPYLRGAISVNVSSMVFDGNAIQYPISIQLIRKTGHRLKYAGSDFISVEKLPREQIAQCESSAKKVFRMVQRLGYRGFCGIDFLLFNGDVFATEVNPRFQGSSILINRALSRCKLPSLLYQQELAVTHGTLPESTVETLNKMDIAESLLRYNSYASSEHTNCIVERNECSTVFSCSLANFQIEDTSQPYYDHFAEIYHLMLPDWEGMLEIQGRVLPNLVKRLAPEARTVLDCMCGIGTQVIGLAKAGYKVSGMDLSSRQIAWANEELGRRKIEADLRCGDCRAIKNVFDGLFDVVIAMDSAMVHLLEPSDVIEMLNSVYNQLSEKGIFLASFRDYDQLKKEHPVSPYLPRVKTEHGTRYTTIRTWEWGDRLLTSHQYVIMENGVNRKLLYDTYRQWPMTKAEIEDLVERSHFKNLTWLKESETSFYQPILCLIK